MASQGVVLKDLIASPDNTDPDDHTLHTSMEQEPTQSHALARKEQEDKGSAQVKHDEDVVDLGWNEDPKLIAHPIVGGMTNEDLWILIRRFNKRVFHLKETDKPPVGGLDLTVAEEEEFSPNKLRSQFERLYMGVILGMLAFVKQTARLRSWRESRRTAAFCAVYFTAWAFDLLIPLLLIVTIALIISPKIRHVMFPPAPLALVDHSTGGVTKPHAGVLGSTDTATGAPENNKGEAVENEASNFVTGIGAIALNTMTGKDPQGEAHTDEDHVTDKLPGPNSLATSVATAKDKASGVNKPSQDKTKVPMETAMWAKMRPLMQMLGTISDVWERFANALDPTPPFHRDVYRLRLAALIVPLLGASMFVTPYMVFKGTTFNIGVALFGDPVITPGVNWINRTFPNWTKILNINNTLLKGVPTNAQLTITLLRLGEANKAPLPPPPLIRESPDYSPVELSGDVLDAAGGDQPLNASGEELHEAIGRNSDMVDDAGGADSELTKLESHSKKRSKVLGFFKGGAKAAVSTAIGADKVRAKAGKESAKQRLGVLPPQNESPVAGPTEFKARYEGKKGHVYLTTKATIPCVAFSPDSAKDMVRDAERENLHPLWSVPVAGIRELKKHSGYGFKSKLLVGWAMEREIRDGLEIVDRQGNTFMVTAIPLRDELFNRLCAMGGQKWELW